MKKILAALLFFLSSVSLYSQSDTSSQKFDFQFKSLQVDATSALFIYTITGCVDFDFYNDGDKGSAGLRAGVDHYVIGDVGGGKLHGSPCTDIDLLGRATLTDGILRFDIYGGFTSHNTSTGNEKSGIYFKFGLEFKARVYRDFVGFIGKLGATKAAYGGIGIFIGYGK